MIPYAIAQGATEIPWAFAQTLLFSCIAYFMIHFDFTAGALPLVLSNFCRAPKVAHWRLISMPTVCARLKAACWCCSFVSCNPTLCSQWRFILLPWLTCGLAVQQNSSGLYFTNS